MTTLHFVTRSFRRPVPIVTTWALAALLGLTALTGCDQQRVARLEEGVASELDVMKQFGVPTEIHQEADGSRTFEFTRQPEGVANYFITIGPDGRMSALRQVLSAPYFAKVQPGMDQAAVRRLLGQPALKQPFVLKEEEVWDWRWLDGQDRKVFRVTFDKAGRVLNAASLADPREMHGGG
jgi:outer membrane protein assembly factor BamE (lipoprotein component of BamABCDE complex)